MQKILSSTSEFVKCSKQDISDFGINDFAFIKKVKIKNNKCGYGIYAANGVSLGFSETKEMAVLTIKQNDLIPLSVH